QRDAALPRLQAALAAIGDHLGDGASDPLDPPPDLIRHSLTVRWPRPPSGASDWSQVLSEARAWHGVFSGLLARGRRGGGSPTTIEQAERMTSGYEGGIVNVNRDAVYVDLHQSGVEVTNNAGNALTPGETSTRREGDSDGDLSMHLDPVFARNMLRFLQAMAGQGVTRMWTAGFLRSAMSPADTHPMGMACDITGFTFSDGTIIHLRSGYPARAGHDRDDIRSGESDWFDYADHMGSRTHAEVMMGIARAMTSYFDRIIGPGANAAHMGHFHVENSPNAEAMARRRGAHELHAVSAHSTHVPDFMRDTAERRDESWDEGVEPIPLTDPRAEAAAAAAGGDEGGDDVDG
ncbi:MAG: hypothetical protein K8M05_31230, partial [Deltaproteobacteria bacterium]|nr:hypothetical protein [Kofleriaceae bacterium]